MIKYLTKNIVLQEIPKEISLSLEITNCPNRCKGCHTPELQQDIGTELTEAELRRIIESTKLGKKFLVSCILFMGGDQHKELISLLKIVKEYDLKTALYTGNDFVDVDIIKELDYVKLGAYVEELGGLTEKTTNQKLFELKWSNDEFWVEQIKLYKEE